MHIDTRSPFVLCQRAYVFAYTNNLDDDLRKEYLADALFAAGEELGMSVSRAIYDRTLDLDACHAERRACNRLLQKGLGPTRREATGSC